jgi:hypothetical protein
MLTGKDSGDSQCLVIHSWLQATKVSHAGQSLQVNAAEDTAEAGIVIRRGLVFNGARHVARAVPFDPGAFFGVEGPAPTLACALPLPEILLLVLCATLSGMEDFVEIRLWGDLRLEFLRRFLPYERGIPAHDTLNDVNNALDPDLFKDCFAAWVESLREAAPDIIAIDGKTSRRSHDRAAGRGPLHLVSAWAARQCLVLGQEVTDAKSNEITAIPRLLERLVNRAGIVGGHCS